MDSQVNVLKTHPLARIPVKDTEGSAGYSLFSAEGWILHPGNRITINTAIALQLSPGTYARIASKSGLAHKYGIQVLGGVIDGDYRGNVGVTLYISGDRELPIKPGYRIAQLIIERIANPCFYEISPPKQLSPTLRGANGYCSTGFSL